MTRSQIRTFVETSSLERIRDKTLADEKLRK